MGNISNRFIPSPFINSCSIRIIYGNPGQLGINNCSNCFSSIRICSKLSYCKKIIDKTIGLRVEGRVEIEGLDTNLHFEESGYNFLNKIKNKNNIQWSMICYEKNNCSDSW